MLNDVMVGGFEQALVNAQIAPSVSQALAEAGRTEDVRFSPSGQRMAVAAYLKNAVLVFGTKVGASGGHPAIEIDSCLEIHSASLSEPHGFDFIDDDTLVVGNRRGRVAVFRLPAQPSGHLRVDLRPWRMVRRMSNGRKVKNPGSLVVETREPGRASILVCQNYRNLVSRHVFSMRHSLLPSQGRVLLKSGLEVPDGITISANGRWLALSNHLTHEVLIYDRTKHLHPDAQPVRRLQGLAYPHGLRFLRDDTMLGVTDAGLPQVVFYTAPDGDWSGGTIGQKSVRVLDEETYARGHRNIAEGGPKGIDFSADGRLMVISCEEQPLVFMDVDRLLGNTL